jgi:hypothetical protein
LIPIVMHSQCMHFTKTRRVQQVGWDLFQHGHCISEVHLHLGVCARRGISSRARSLKVCKSEGTQLKKSSFFLEDRSERRLTRRLEEL